ncbi:NUDIX domain-containing protein [Acetobacteraceae bacterium]|nr:NUDIX domain-containing protein [Candidatus Parcubacteria bacterium]
MPQRKRWVCGFLFRNNEEVALVKKTHPSWQAGKLNGVGGGIDGKESPLQAMQREFLEEAGVKVDDWKEFALLKVQDGDVHFFVAHGDYPLKSVTDEKVEWYKISDLKNLPIIRNLKWLIVLAFDPDVKYAEIDYFQSRD